MKRLIALCLVGLFLAVSFVIAEDSIGPYNPIADVNKDGVVDIMDLVEVGQSYGSNYTLKSETNKTVVTVVSFAKEPPEIEGARVAVDVKRWYGKSEIGYTNSSGVIVLELSPNSTHRAFAWNGSSYNYVDFSTNSRGEASVMVILGEPTVPEIRSLPRGWVVFSLLNKTTGQFWSPIEHELDFYIQRIEWSGWSVGWTGPIEFNGVVNSPVFSIPSSYFPGGVRPNTGYGCYVYYDGSWLGSSTFQTDENVSANVIIYILTT